MESAVWSWIWAGAHAYTPLVIQIDAQIGPPK
jgi:hypothetical protein